MGPGGFTLSNYRYYSRVVLLLFSSISLTTVFQNCSPGGFAVSDEQFGLELSSSILAENPITCTLPNGSQLTPGNTISGFAMMSALSPMTCGSQVQRTCLATGQFDGSVPVHAACLQQCRHPDNSQAVDSGFQFVYFTRASGATQAECDAARVSSSCQQATGLFAPAVPAQRFATCLVQGQTCAYTASNGTATPSGNNAGAMVTGFSLPSATYPSLCGISASRTCQANGQWTGTTPVYTACSQKCLHPDTSQPVDANSQYIYFTRASGTSAECSAAQIASSCQQSSGLFAPAVSATRFTTCQILDVPEKVTHEMLTGVDTRFNVFKQNCTSCHNNTQAYGNLNMVSPQQSKDKAALILSRMKHVNKALGPMPPAGTITDPFKMALVEKWVSLGAPADALNQPAPTVPTAPPAPTPPANLALNCDIKTAIPKVPLKRLSKTQYTNAVMALLNNGGYLGWSERNNEAFRLVGTLTPLMGTIPNDNAALNTFSSIDQSMTPDHFFSYVVVSSAISDQISKNYNWLNGSSKVSCLNTIANNVKPTEACLRTFIKKFGQKALRKKIELAEENEYLAIYNSGTTAQDGFATLVQTFLLSPRFLNIVEVDGRVSNSDPNLLELNDFELAQRLSFHYLKDIPTDAMIDSALLGAFTASEASYLNEVQKVTRPDLHNLSGTNSAKFDSYYSTNPSGQSQLERSYHNFINEWLEVEKIPHVSDSYLVSAIDLLYGPTRNYGNSNVSAPIQNALKSETYNFVHRMTWSDRKFYDLLTDRSIIADGYTRSFYYLPEPTTTYSYGHAMQTLTTHTGILTRAVTTLRDGVGDDTHPFLRGTFIRRKILCDVLPSPNADALPDRALSAGEITGESKRIQYEAKVTAPECVGCHTQINPLGFALDDYDSLSRFRGGKFEPVYKLTADANGNVTYTLLKQVPVNASVTNLNIDQPTGESANGGVQFSEYVGNSYKANMCFARQVMRHTLGRFETSQDACMLNEMYNKMRSSDGSIKKMYFELPLTRDFKMKRIGG